MSSRLNAFVNRRLEVQFLSRAPTFQALTLSVISLESSGVIRVLKRQVFNLRRDSYQRDSKFRFDLMDQASEVRREPADRDGTI